MGGIPGGRPPARNPRRGQGGGKIPDSRGAAQRRAAKRGARQEARPTSFIEGVLRGVETYLRDSKNSGEFSSWIERARQPKTILEELQRIKAIPRGGEVQTNFFITPEFFQWKFNEPGFEAINPYYQMRERLKNGGRLVVYTSQRFLPQIRQGMAEHGFAVSFTPVARVPEEGITDPMLHRIFHDKRITSVGELTITLKRTA